jgi:hypothetical protein
VPPLLEPAEELWEADELAAEKLPERPLLPLEELPPARPPEPPEKTLECGADGGATEREDMEKLRAGAADGRAPGFETRIAAVEVGAALRPAPTEPTFIEPARAFGDEPEASKRCAAALYARDEPPPRATPRAAEFPPAMVRSTRDGDAAGETRPFSVFVGTDFTAFHCVPLSTGVAFASVPLETVKTPRVRFSGVLP